MYFSKNIDEQKAFNYSIIYTLTDAGITFRNT